MQSHATLTTTPTTTPRDGQRPANLIKRPYIGLAVNSQRIMSTLLWCIMVFIICSTSVDVILQNLILFEE